MDLTGRYTIPAAPTTVWDALNDAEILKACIPGCEAVEKISPTEFLATATLKIGSMKARFKCKVVLAELECPRRCVVHGEGQGGAAGFAKGEAEVLLAADGAGTVLTYAAKASVGGKLAQIGQRLIDGAARQIADEFFGRFAALLTHGKSESAKAKIGVTTPLENIGAAEPSRRKGLPLPIWLAGFVAIVVILMFLLGALL